MLNTLRPICSPKMSTLFFFLSISVCRPHPSSIIPRLPNTNHPPSISSITGLKTRPKVSRRVHIVSIKSLASYSTWCRCLFALVDGALEKARQSSVTLYLSQNIKNCLAQTYSNDCLGLCAPGQTFDISPLGSQHTLTRGEIPLLALPQNGSFVSFIPLYHKLIFTRFSSSENPSNMFRCLRTLPTNPRYDWLRPRGFMSLILFLGLVNRRNRRGFYQLRGVLETVNSCFGFLSISFN